MNSENLSASEENILANSIRIARQRISSQAETVCNNEIISNCADSHIQYTNTPSQSFSKSKRETTPAAQAIKVTSTAHIGST